MSYEDHDQGDDDRRSYDDDGAGVAERCAEMGALGACDEPADMHCPGCGRALCYACAAPHCRRDAPACGRAMSPATIDHREKHAQ